MTHRSSFTVGMPHMVTDQLSEVELLKLAADFQWTQIGDAVGCPPHKLVNDAGDRLYSSLINVETNFGPNTICQYGEGDRIQLAGTIRFHARQFIEGWVQLTKGEETVSDAELQAIQSKNDLARSPHSWIYMTMAVIGRVAGNVRLKTFRPAGIEKLRIPETTETPAGMVEHEDVLHSGDVVFPDKAIPVPLVRGEPVVYQIMEENDLNGAGLVYFARYVAMMNYAERMQLLRGLARPLSSRLTNFLCTQSRRVYYFGNAPINDRVCIYSKIALDLPDDGEKRTSPTRTTVGRMIFRHELYRESDGELMAISLVTKALTIPIRQKATYAAAERFIHSLQG